jgi:hypothetical protein
VADSHKTSLVAFTVIFSGSFAEFSGATDPGADRDPETGFNRHGLPSRAFSQPAGAWLNSRAELQIRTLGMDFASLDKNCNITSARKHLFIPMPMILKMNLE